MLDVIVIVYILLHSITAVLSFYRTGINYAAINPELSCSIYVKQFNIIAIIYGLKNVNMYYYLLKKITVYLTAEWHYQNGMGSIKLLTCYIATIGA